MDEFNVGVVGAGHVGLVTGACMAHLGYRVTLVDTDAGRVADLRRGKMPIYEPGLEEFVAGVAGRLTFATELARVVPESDVIFMAVDTPQGEDGSADLSNVADVARGIGKTLAGSRRASPLVVINKCTVPVGGGDFVTGLIREGSRGVGGGDERFFVVSNPEFLREGTAIYDSLFPDRIVVGTDSQEALEVLRVLYQPIVGQSFPTELDPRPKVAVPFVVTDLVSAEMIKYAANAFLATKISFINEISNLCEPVGAEVTDVAHGIGLDGRIGPRFLGAGIGWGGSCFPKDVAALRAMAREHDYEPTLLDATVAVNDRQRERAVHKLRHALGALEGRRVALLGLSFKPNTDDLRDAPSLALAAALGSSGAEAVGYDPVAGERLAASKTMPALRIAPDLYQALEGSHAAVVVTEWEEIRVLDLRRAASLMKEPRVLVDGRNILDPGKAREAGLRYAGFGRD